MSRADDLFGLSDGVRAEFAAAGPSIPVILVDDVYQRPDEIREMALGLSYEAPASYYPGKIAVPPVSDSLREVTEWALRIANEDYLPRVPPIFRSDGLQIKAFRQVLTDFAIIDVHPEELSLTQQLPHVDPVPVFGLIYLNREERGGTLFFEKLGKAAGGTSHRGYVTTSNSEYTLLGRIEGAFNRMAIYPGFVPHSGQIAGDWIEDEQRFTSPRLTQRFIFLP